jgi:ketosteroid isomerase-like protein
MTPKQTVQNWIEAFNSADVDKLYRLYHPDAVNHQVANEPVVGREAIKAMFEMEFSQAEMYCIAENLFEDGEWAILMSGKEKYCFKEDTGISFLS